MQSNLCLCFLFTFAFSRIEQYDLHHDKTCLCGFETRSDTNRAVQPQIVARGLKFRNQDIRDCTTCIYVVKIVIDQWGYCAASADLGLCCFYLLAYSKSRFSHDVAHFLCKHGVNNLIPLSNTFFCVNLVMKTILCSFSQEN